MASSRSYLQYILCQMAKIEGITHRAMMGEYILYVEGRIFGGIYDDRLLVKPVPAAVKCLPDAPRELPYEGAKEMLLVEETDDAAFLKQLVEAMLPELPERKPRRKAE
ncbi:MAG: TfoX/Sxy family protein [Eubacteriales bacterium]|nr:TfoX/Sxy family protein [Eubacteriales bacterium]